MRVITPRRAGGGVYHALIGTLEQVGIAALIAVPLGLLTAVYLVEYGRRHALARRAISFFVDVMTGIPSIVAGLFIYTAFVLTLGHRALRLRRRARAVDPDDAVVVRSTEEMLKLVPRRAARGLATRSASRSGARSSRSSCPPRSRGIITGVMLAVARVAGRDRAAAAAPVRHPAPSTRTRSTGPSRRCPLFICDQCTSGTDASVDRAWGGALVLIVFVMILNLVAAALALDRPQDRR